MTYKMRSASSLHVVIPVPDSGVRVEDAANGACPRAD